MLFYRTTARTAFQERLDSDKPEVDAADVPQTEMSDLAAEGEAALRRMLMGAPAPRKTSAFQVELMEAWMQP